MLLCSIKREFEIAIDFVKFFGHIVSKGEIGIVIVYCWLVIIVSLKLE